MKMGGGGGSKYNYTIDPLRDLTGNRYLDRTTEKLNTSGDTKSVMCDVIKICLKRKDKRRSTPLKKDLDVFFRISLYDPKIKKMYCMCMLLSSCY